jgi:hypothetical protein
MFTCPNHNLLLNLLSFKKKNTKNEDGEKEYENVGK